jgi:glyoxylase-like metal-dependent hydrolase (beta-lactamase superfamily II)
MSRAAPPGPAAASGGCVEDPQSVKLREVAPGVVQVFLPLPSKPTIVNVYLLDCGGEWALVDTGVALRDSREALLAAAREIGVEPGAIKNLLATHHHPDHFGASRAYREEMGGAIHLHPLELDRIAYALSAGAEDMVVHSRRHGIPIPATGMVGAPRPSDVWAGTFQPVTEVQHPVADGEVLELGKRRLQVVWTPGHTPGHCCYLDLGDRVLFVGDHLLPKITPHVGVYATGPTNPLQDFLASQEKVAALDVRLVCPAHGGVYADHRHRARQLVAHHEVRASEMYDVLQAGPATAYEVARKAFRWVFEEPVENRFQIGAAVMETIAHLELLRGRGLVERHEEEGLLRYAAR